MTAVFTNDSTYGQPSLLDSFLARLLTMALCGIPMIGIAEPVKVHGRFQAGVIANDNGSDNVFPTGFLNFDEGFNLNRIDTIIEKPLDTNLRPRVGPFPGPASEDFAWGFEVMIRYGQDTPFTFGFDDDLAINEGRDNQWLMPQWFVTAHLPVWEGVSLMAGSFFTPMGFDIGAPIDPPNAFYTHSYAFVYQPATHVGALASVRLPLRQDLGMFSVDAGVVQGWNNLQDNNDDKSFIGALRWRSPDFRTWVDLEALVGNEQSEDGVTDQTRPFNAVSSRGEKLRRDLYSLTVIQRLNGAERWVFNSNYGQQEGGDVIADRNNPPGFLITEDSSWYGANFNYYRKFGGDKQWALRAEWLRDEEGAHALLPAGDYYGVTANVSWWLSERLRLRPELRYDWYDGDGLPFGGRVPAVFFGEEDSQGVISLDLTWFFDVTDARKE